MLAEFGKTKKFVHQNVNDVKSGKLEFGVAECVSDNYGNDDERFLHRAYTIYIAVKGPVINTLFISKYPEEVWLRLMSVASASVL